MLGLIVFSSVSGLNAQHSLMIRTDTGIPFSYELDQVNRITFSEGSMLIHHTDNQTYAHMTHTIKQLAFSLLSTGVTDKKASSPGVRPLLFPNPSYDRINLQVNVREEEILDVGLFDLQGGRLYDLTKEARMAGNNLSLDISRLIKGTYIVRMVFHGRLESIPLIKY